MRDVISFSDSNAIGETSRALCVVIEAEPFWLPKRLIHPDSEVRALGDAGELITSLAWAERRGLTDAGTPFLIQ